MSDDEKTHEIEGEKWRIQGHEFTLDVLDASYMVEEISAALPEGATHKEFLEQFGAWVKDQTGVELTRGGVDLLWRSLGVVFERRKRFFQDALEATRTSPSSTA